MGSTEAVIRPAKLTDIGAIVALGEWMATEAPNYSHQGFEGEILAEYLVPMIKSGGVFVAEQDGAMAGTLVAMYMPGWFNEYPMVIELALFVLPRYRGGGTAAKLLGAFEEWGRSLGVSGFQLEEGSGVTPDSVHRLYSALGYRQTGTIWMKDLPAAGDANDAGRPDPEASP